METTERAAAAAAILDTGRLRYPESLPITERHDELLEIIRDHQVVIVAGETGSGKSTQIPKLCIEAGRGADGVIGHTQPRRVAARTIAERIADEIGSELGADVGYSVRFNDNISDGTLVRVMTDGILLAEIQRDRMLSRYDTLIIDEAHERSLNIDFILGYLKQLLPRRRDLKVIVTSATIDTERFAEHFASDDGEPAPIVTVSGRTFPVETRYRPFGADNPDDEHDRRDQVDAIVDACKELKSEGDGDVLVFLSGEREIHDAADALKRLDEPSLEVLPLYARLSSQEQQRIWKPHAGRRIVLSTNVAETSITVPGVRYVIDAGTARISRYSRRLKVQRLPIEEVSKASANQRAGRCGRVAPGICIRLYSEENFEERPDFTEPEILRTNLGSVILQMANIGLGDIARFPFVEPPDHRSIRDGEMLLDELGAIRTRPSPSGDGNTVRLTKIGQRLARLPVDPRLARMVIEAERLNCVREVLIIVSALSIQDVRERPDDKREQAAEMHNRFKVKGSDLLSLVKLWDYTREKQRELSGNQFRRMCRSEFIHFLRLREWMDLHSQLKRAAGVKIKNAEAHPDHIHQALLAGLLSHVGMRDRDRRAFKGARQAEFVIAPGSVLTKKPPDWVMAAELVETNQIYARRVAEIDPRWAEKAGAHLVKRSYGEPRWDPKGGRAVVTEQVTLYGLPLVSDRLIGLDRVDPDAARAWFITKAFVEGDVAEHWSNKHRFFEFNDGVRRRVSSMSARMRGVELLDDQTLFDFYDERIDDDVTSAQHFDRWWKQERQKDGKLLDLTDRALARLLSGSGGAGGALGVTESFPDVWRQGDIELPLTYRYAPGEPLDGVTVHLPLSGLNQITDDGFDWHVPGNRDDVVEQLMRSLPKPIRRELVPFNDTVDLVLDRLGAPNGRLVDRLAEIVSEISDVRVSGADFDPTVLDPHLRLNIVVSDDAGEVHDVGTDLAAIKARLVSATRESVAAAAPIEERRGITSWDVGDIPRVVESSDRGFDVRAYPTLLDVGDSVALRVVTTPELQERAMKGGVRRLLLLDGAPTRASIERLVTTAGRFALTGADIDVSTLVDDCIAAAVDQLMAEHGVVPFTESGFRELRAEVKAKAANRAGVALGKAVAVVAAANTVSQRLADLRAPAVRSSVDDANMHVGRLVRPGFVSAHGVDRLDDVERYVRAISYRLEHLAGAAARDQQRMLEILPLEQRFASFVDRLPPGAATAEVAEVRWLLEELRVQIFAQPVGTRGKVSPKKVAQRLATIGA
ncbi:ATP-dependent RNA helicase HrpA [Ilumatobacter coccineus]|uniref:ATP-dependent RNA helicase HrpA n=1 Tax=Ilumatobacter coccineus (strain NBRC 103263 / KCTC 29153 / YM16-304) TaxID=1313172 RepID=A0A6C7E8N5_ILUCY|nr:ATP-dependent RNA helicase HrpA [Ilumatobacter coccineus]BAN01515.1 ATP-dependent RNA helicase HrpA [Ilumatobacter coccineus YM16-304]